jgi:hypothetical protein
MSIASTPHSERLSPVHRFAAAALAALDRVGDAPAWAMTPDEQAETLVELTRVQERLTELRLRVLAAADRNQIGDKTGATSTAAWLAHATREKRARAHSDLRLATTLDQGLFDDTRAALAAGVINEDQARVIVRAVEELPCDEVSDEDRCRAQRHLIDLAGEYDAKRLRFFALRLFEVLAPEEADRREEEALRREEQRARETCRFSMRDNGDGTTNGWFKLPTAQAEMLGKAVQALAAPRRRGTRADGGADGKPLPYAALLGQAFAELVEHLPVDALPQSGGVAATVVVSIDLEKLRAGVGAGSLDTGARVSAGQLRRLACNCGIIPAVLGSGSVPLDLGRTARLHTKHQRIAMELRDGGCTAEGCERPPAWCEAHHETPWSEGGGTSVGEGRLLCPRHHHLAHDDRYDTRTLPDGRLRFHRRT